MKILRIRYMQTVAMLIFINLISLWSGGAQSNGWHIDANSSISKVQFYTRVKALHQSYISQILSEPTAVLASKYSKDTDRKYRDFILTKKELLDHVGSSCYVIVFGEKGLRSNILRANAYETYENIYRFRQLSATVLTELLDLKEDFYISSVPTARLEEGRVLDLNLGPAQVSWVHANEAFLNGEGYLLGFKESNFNNKDIDLQGKEISVGLASDIISNHATEVAVVGSGAGRTNRTGKGVAFKASIASSSFDQLLPDNLDFFPDNLTVQNHSYGVEISNDYEVLAYAYDLVTLSNPMVTHVFSSGNQGESSQNLLSSTSYQGYATLTGEFKTAKNVIVVGAVDTLGRSNSFSSFGPTSDGRIKPDLSTYSMAGTSNATAVVSGSIILLQQLYDSLYNIKLSADAVRALLINSSSDVKDPGPDHKNGWGLLDLKTATQSVREYPVIQDTIGDDQRLWSTEFSIDESTAELSLTLAWLDLPGIPGTTEVLLNDLDLQLIDPEGRIYDPWTLSTYPAVDSLEAAAVRKPDHVNTSERITLLNPELGSYQLLVRGTRLSSRNQAFSVAIATKSKNRFEWTFPNRSDNMPFDGESYGYLTWETDRLDQGILQLQEIGSSEGWQTLHEDVSLAQQSIRWLPPDTLYGTYISRMLLSSGEFFQTDTFTISTPTTINLDLICADSAVVSWPEEDIADYYIVNEYTEDKERYYETSNNQWVIQKLQAEHHYLSVTPVVKGVSLMSSFAINLASVGSTCYIQSFYSETVPEQGIQSLISLSSVNGIEQILLYRLADGERILVDQLVSSRQLQYTLQDDNPRVGLNTYQVDLLLENQIVVTSEESSSYYFGTEKVTIFPNPLQSNRLLTIYNEGLSGLGLYISIFDLMGKLVLKEPLTSDQQLIDVSNWPVGIYLYQLNSPVKHYSGKIIINQ